MTIKYDRLMNVKPGSMPAVMEMGPKFPELAKKILGEEYAGGVKFYSRVMGPLNQVMWSWEVESFVGHESNLYISQTKIGLSH